MEDDRPRDRPGLAQLCSTLGAAGREGGREGAPRRRMGREGIWGKIVNVPGRDSPPPLPCTPFRQGKNFLPCCTKVEMALAETYCTSSYFPFLQLRRIDQTKKWELPFPLFSLVLFSLSPPFVPLLPPSLVTLPAEYAKEGRGREKRK